MADILAGRYRFDERIAAGGVGVVWKAFDLTLQREVAVKTLDITASHDDAEAVPRFRREAIATAGLSSPHIVTVYDTGVDGDLAFLVMELLTGPSLRELVKEQGYLDFAEGLSIAQAVAEGLADAHAIGVIHRDIKPGNVMMHNGVPKIVDFGIARLEQTAGEELTRTATMLGTPTYMAPEQVRGEAATPASDIYGLGCLAMTIFTGRPPFVAELPIAVTHAHVRENPPKLSELRPGAPEALDELIAHMLAKDPADRPDAATVVRELKKIAADPSVPSGLAPLAPASEEPTMALPTDPTLAVPLAEKSPALPPEIPPTESDKSDEPQRTRFFWLIVGLAVALAAALTYLAIVVFGGESPKHTPQTTQAPTPSLSKSVTPTQTQTPTQTPSNPSPSASSETPTTTPTQTQQTTEAPPPPTQTTEAPPPPPQTTEVPTPPTTTAPQPTNSGQVSTPAGNG